MTKVLLRVLSRAGQSIHNPFAVGNSYVIPKRGDAAGDFQAVTRDMKRVGEDLRVVTTRELKRHGK